MQERTMGKLDGRVAFITGAARGQGRSHAIRLAQEGADILAVDICAQIDSVTYSMSTPSDFTETVRAVEAEGRRILARQGDVRDEAALRAAIDEGTGSLGPVNIVVANAGIAPMSIEANDREWGDVLDVNLTGVYNTVAAALPSMIDGARGGAIVLTSSVAALIGVGGNTPGMLAYTAAKTGVVGLTRAWANYLAPHNIRVNAVATGGVRTPMMMNDNLKEFSAQHPEFSRAMKRGLPGGGLIEPVDVSNAIAFLVSDDARYITGVVLPIDAGTTSHG
jgi:SDR family mycofactocin-dependent oxidoreductase